MRVQGETNADGVTAHYAKCLCGKLLPTAHGSAPMRRHGRNCPTAAEFNRLARKDGAIVIDTDSDNEVEFPAADFASPSSIVASAGGLVTPPLLARGKRPGLSGSNTVTKRQAVVAGSASRGGPSTSKVSAGQDGRDLWNRDAAGVQWLELRRVRGTDRMMELEATRLQ